MRCQLCGGEVEVLVLCKRYSSRGIMICPHCQQQVRQHYRKPYSKVMEQLALAEAGYKVNRKSNM